MHSPLRYRDPHRQRGDVLIEALIAVLLSSIIGAGTAYLTSRMVLSAKNQRLDGIAAQQMRELLQRYGDTLCAGGGNHDKARVLAPNGSFNRIRVVCTPGAVATFNGVSVHGTTTVMLCSTTDPTGHATGLPPLAVGSGDPNACKSEG